MSLNSRSNAQILDCHAFTLIFHLDKGFHYTWNLYQASAHDNT